MTEGQKNRLLATLVGIEQVRAQIARAARDGQSPAQSGRALTPLPQPVWQEIEQALASLSGHAQAIAEQFAGEAVRERQAREPLGATLYWVSFLARRLDEEVIADLSPERMARFGKLSDEARTALDEAIERMHRDLETVRGQIDALRQGRTENK